MSWTNEIVFATGNDAKQREIFMWEIVKTHYNFNSL